MVPFLGPDWSSPCSQLQNHIITLVSQKRSSMSLTGQQKILKLSLLAYFLVWLSHISSISKPVLAAEEWYPLFGLAESFLFCSWNLGVELTSSEANGLRVRLRICWVNQTNMEVSLEQHGAVDIGHPEEQMCTRELTSHFLPNADTSLQDIPQSSTAWTLSARKFPMIWDMLSNYGTHLGVRKFFIMLNSNLSLLTPPSWQPNAGWTYSHLSMSVTYIFEGSLIFSRLNIPRLSTNLYADIILYLKAHWFLILLRCLVEKWPQYLIYYLIGNAITVLHVYFRYLWM